MTSHPVKTLIQAADRAIGRENFDVLLDFHAEEATLTTGPASSTIAAASI